MWREGKFEIDRVLLEYSAKVYGEPSKYGINGGRTSKLEIKRCDNNETIVFYDRCWVVKPEGDLAKKALNYLLNLGL